MDSNRDDTDGSRREEMKMERGSFSWTLGELVYVKFKPFPEMRCFDTKDNMVLKP